MLRFISTITARKAYQARAAFREAFRGYYATGYKNASSFIQERVATAKDAGLPQDDFLMSKLGYCSRLAQILLLAPSGFYATFVLFITTHRSSGRDL
jgi:hypothetical protein